MVAPNTPRDAADSDSDCVVVEPDNNAGPLNQILSLIKNQTTVSNAVLKKLDSNTVRFFVENSTPSLPSPLPVLDLL